MTLQEAIEQSPKCNDTVLVSICMYCQEPLNERSRLILEQHGRIEYILSHGTHKSCLEADLKKQGIDITL